MKTNTTAITAESAGRNATNRNGREGRSSGCSTSPSAACGATPDKQPAPYARTLAMLEERRAPLPAAAMAATGGSLLQRIRRIVGQPAAARTTRSTWLAGALVILTVCVILPLAIATGSGEPDDFDFANPPMGYEKEIRKADANDQFRADGLRFKLSITGQVIGTDGKPAIAYRVTALPEKWSASWGMMPSVMTGADGTFIFRGLPDGPCDVSATPAPLTDQPNMRVERVVQKKGESVNVTLSLEEKHSFSGRFTDAKGRPQPDRNVLAIWKDPTGQNTYSSHTKTDAEGRYRFNSPFEVAQHILINDGETRNINEHRNVQPGRKDVDFQLSDGPVEIEIPAEEEQGRDSGDASPDEAGGSLRERAADAEEARMASRSAASLASLAAIPALLLIGLAGLVAGGLWMGFGVKSGAALGRGALVLALAGIWLGLLAGLALHLFNMRGGLFGYGLFLACEMGAFVLGWLARRATPGKAAFIVAAVLMLGCLLFLA